ncbi:hypothetical protein Cch01nite_13390 [Cellulomonas chitinilytica]|uniref:Uncharacterized protein n=1 Tax=Cellulomonas chitinilytica TaxID=398759 RepID=A0A919TYH9_9CELL|nr:hypothetical protein [Cellulomonas chitinilytica]GIG20615.1 hypothetical protein Cch01nite_13390 [Cellulomonas chitinilytica]
MESGRRNERTSSASWGDRQLVLNAWFFASGSALAGLGLLVTAFMTSTWQLAAAAVLLFGTTCAQASIIRRRRAVLNHGDLDLAGHAAMVGALSLLGFIAAVVLCSTAT